MVNLMDEKILLVSPECPGCEELREHMAASGTANKFKIVDVSSSEGRDLAKKLGITHVPNCVITKETSEGLVGRVCTPEELLQLIQGK